MGWKVAPSLTRRLSSLAAAAAASPRCSCPSSPSSSSFSSSSTYTILYKSRALLLESSPSRYFLPRFTITPYASSRTFSSASHETSQGPAAIDYSSLLEEGDFHRLANSTVHDLQEKFEEYGDTVQIDGFDVEYGNEVLTVKLGSLGTYVLNKQTPNRQLWLSSPVSGPSRYDWDQDAQAWVYRRTRANLLRILENEFQQLCGEPIKLA